MKITQKGILFLLTMSIFFSCKKKDEPVIVIHSDTAVIGKVVTKNDTSIVQVGAITITFSVTAPCFPNTEIFKFTANGNSSIPTNASYQWYFGDGNQATGKSVQHGFNASSSYVVALNVFDDKGFLIHKSTFPVKAWGQQMRLFPSFSYKFDFTENVNYVTFNSSSVTNKGTIVQYRWDWGDNSSPEISSNGLTRHQFPFATTDKVYSVKLTITNNAGCTADTTMPITIPALYPISGSFNAAQFDACTNEYFIFTPAATNVPTGSIYVWNFSDGRGDTVGNQIRYSYKFMNDYDVIMSIYLNNRLIYKVNKLVNAKGSTPKPKASFYETLVSNHLNEQMWSFNSTSIIKSGGIDGYFWDFGNGKTNSDYYSFIESTYQKENFNKTYQIRLIVTGNGCADTAYRSIVVPSK
jgi:PKD domain